MQDHLTHFHFYHLFSPNPNYTIHENQNHIINCCQHQVILSDLLTAPPHLPAQPLHLFQLHDGERKRNNPQSFCHSFPQLGCWSSSPFSFALLQIQYDRLTIHTTEIYFSCSSAWDQPSISFSSLFRISLTLFQHQSSSVFWVLKPQAYSPCLSIRLQSLFALRRLHSAS